MRLFYNLCRDHVRTCNPDNKEVKQVLPRFREKTIKMLTENGYDSDGYPVKK